MLSLGYDFLSDSFNIRSNNLKKIIGHKKIRKIQKTITFIGKNLDEKIEELKMKEYLLRINNESYKADFKYKDFELEACEENLFNFNIDIYV